MAKLLLITPPFTQLNTPYPATAYLKGFLNTKGITSFQVDLGIEVILEIFSRAGLKQMFEYAEGQANERSENAARISDLMEEYCATIDAVIAFLQGKQPTLARNICSMQFLPQASRFNQLEELDWAFGTMGMQDKAKHLATLYLEDLSDFIVECIDPHFGFSRYAERLGRSANSFDELYLELNTQLTYIDAITLSLLEQKIKQEQPGLICFSVPFPGNLYSAFRCAQFVKKEFPGIKTAMGGGFPNTELRSVNDARVFEFFDFITLDDGERPIELLHQHIFEDKPQTSQYKRTFHLQNGVVTYSDNSPLKDYKQSEVGTPDYSDLLLESYISVIEIANPMHSLWSDGRWNKLTMAHGCYWGKCTFCDVSLDYIKIYEPIAARQIVDRMEQMIAQTGERGFHFVDEAAPPALMREVALEILSRKLSVTWWTNIRFEKSFTLDLCRLLKASGCIAVSGGLEVASDRLLALINKGVTVEQVARVTDHFSQAGIMVHAYLMYGYPTQTVQETVDSLELVRQMFELGILQSGFWHQFALTAHSPIGLNPDEFGIIPTYNEIKFANNDVAFADKTGIDHDQFSFGLKKSLFNYMHGLCFDYPLQEWFEFKIPKTKVKSDFIEQCLADELPTLPKSNVKMIWLGTRPHLSNNQKSKKGKTFIQTTLKVNSKTGFTEVIVDENVGKILIELIEMMLIKPISFDQFKKYFEEKSESDIEVFWFSKSASKLREIALLIV